MKRPAGLVNVNVVACSSQANQAGVSTVIGLASCPGRTNLAPSTCAVVRGIREPSATRCVRDVMVGVYGWWGKCASRVRRCPRPESRANAHMRVVACGHTCAYRVGNEDPALIMPHVNPSIAHGCTCLGSHAMIHPVAICADTRRSAYRAMPDTWNGVIAISAEAHERALVRNRTAYMRFRAW